MNLARVQQRDDTGQAWLPLCGSRLSRGKIPNDPGAKGRRGRQPGRGNRSSPGLGAGASPEPGAASQLRQSNEVPDRCAHFSNSDCAKVATNEALQGRYRRASDATRVAVLRATTTKALSEEACRSLSSIAAQRRRAHAVPVGSHSMRLRWTYRRPIRATAVSAISFADAPATPTSITVRATISQSGSSRSTKPSARKARSKASFNNSISSGVYFLVFNKRRIGIGCAPGYRFHQYHGASTNHRGQNSTSEDGSSHHGDFQP